MAKPYVKLRMALMENDVKQEEIAAVICVNPATFSRKINGKTPFNLWEAYKMLSVLKIADDQISEYFPSKFAIPFENVQRRQGQAVASKKAKKKLTKGAV